MTDVRCKVDGCVFWAEGNHCTADEIWVKYDFSDEDDDDLLYQADLEIGDDPLGDSIELGPFTSSQTCCETMRPKNEPG